MGYSVRPLAVTKVNLIINIYAEMKIFWHLLLYIVIITADILHHICHLSIYRHLAFMFIAESLIFAPYVINKAYILLNYSLYLW